jgi:hypothetical protein
MPPTLGCGGLILKYREIMWSAHSSASSTVSTVNACTNRSSTVYTGRAALRLEVVLWLASASEEPGAPAMRGSGDLRAKHEGRAGGVRIQSRKQLSVAERGHQGRDSPDHDDERHIVCGSSTYNEWRKVGWTNE